jgi:ABC-type branched-subunit amino acid transport system ATPase component/branched-subunit amino acid ABC-type transport system permease component
VTPHASTVTTIGDRMTSRQARPTLVAALAVAIFLGFVVRESWTGNPITGDSLLFFLIVGVTIGSIYAVAASGLVVTYTTSGIFNFAQGAIGMIMAFVYWELKVNSGVQTFVALLLTVLVAAPLFGIAIERVLMRRLTDAPLVAKLVVTIGLMLALIGIASWIWDPNEPRSIGTFFGSDGFNVAQTFVPWYRVITIVAGLLLALLLRVVLYRTRLGIAMRAVVDNRDLAALNGARPGRVSMFSWALGSSMAALAGIFLAEELSNLNVEALTLLIVDAFAAAIIGRLRSLPLTYFGGILIGLAVSFQQNFLTWSGRWTQATPAIPIIILFLALLFVPPARIEGRTSQRVITPHVPTIRTAAIAMAILFGLVLALSLVLGRTDVRTLTLGVSIAFIMLSLVPLTGWAGQISLAQITFAGVGAFALVEWGSGLGGFGGLLLAGLFAVPFGVMMALPALRLQGLYLALASMAFARMAEFVFFDQPEVFGNGARRIGSLSILGFDVSEPFDVFGVHFGQDAGMLLFVTALFGIVGVGVVALRRGSLGRRLIAMRDSPAACATLGVNLLATKLIVFAISAAIAGFAGALVGVHLGSAGTRDFQMLNGLSYVLLVVVGGVGVVSGALFGGVQFVAFQTWIAQLLPSITVFGRDLFQLLPRAGPGLAGIAIGRQPAGVIPTVGHDVRARNAQRRAKRGPPSAGTPKVAQPERPATAPKARVGTPECDVALLSIGEVSVRFGGVQALDDITIDVETGRVTGLIGPNGAGKTTLFNVITGLQSPNAGRVVLDGDDVTHAKPHRRARLGIGRTFQRLETFGTLTVRDNVRVAAEMRRGWSREHFDTRALVQDIIGRIGLDSVADERVDGLATGTARLVEVARALATKPRVLLLDEPSSGLDESETRALGTLLRDLASSGLAVLLVEHDMRFVMGTCDNIHVLDFGRLIAAGRPDEIQADPSVRAAYLGSGRARTEVDSCSTPNISLTEPVDYSALLAAAAPSDGGVAAAAIELSGITAGYGTIEVLDGVDLAVMPGQVFALFGPNGAGKSTTLKVLSGQVRPNEGSIYLHGEDVTSWASDRLARDGVCLVPEGRGIFPNLTVTENLRMAVYTGTSSRTVFDRAFERFPLLRERRKQVAGTLSGGEQQMLSMARAMAIDPKVLLLDELSMGLAPLIVEELYEVVKRIASEDVSILIVEQFAHEVLGVADAAAIMLHGQVQYCGDPVDVGAALDAAYLGGTVGA